MGYDYESYQPRHALRLQVLIHNGILCSFLYNLFHPFIAHALTVAPSRDLLHLA